MDRSIQERENYLEKISSDHIKMEVELINEMKN
jgi:hypothetical protein